MTMILAAMFEILFGFLAEMVLNVVLVLAMGAFTLLMEIATYVIASGLIDGTLMLLA